MTVMVEAGPAIVKVGAGILVVGVLLVIGRQGGQTVDDVKGTLKPVPAKAHSRNPMTAIRRRFSISAVAE